jgi:hypothetical protein
MSAGEYANQQFVDTFTLEFAGLAAADTQCAAIVQQIAVKETRNGGNGSVMDLVLI